MTPLAKVLFLLSSYAPLWALIAVRFDAVEPSRLSVAPYLSWSFVALTLGSLAAFAFLLSRLKAANPVVISIRSYARNDDHILSYVVTYFPPLFSLDLAKPHDLWSLAILYVTVGIVYVRADAFYVNPLFALAGFRSYEITTSSGRTFAALADGKLRLQAGQDVKGSEFDGLLFIRGR